jgi:UDP-N-acetylglucosamine 4,6-dehydratase
MSVLENSSILVTGGTGSFGKAFIRYALDNLNPRRIAILSRDELKQSDMKKDFPDDRLRWFIGDIRDPDRLKRAFHGVEHVVHAAALKQVDTAEYNPFEYVKTNVLGSQNVIEACLDAGVRKVVALSTDKASSPINLYGATKLTADKLFVGANNYSNAEGADFSVVRYGNVMGSRGSVIPFFRQLVAEGKPLPVTDLRMTRFWITLPKAVQFVVDSFDQMNGGELFVPRIPSMRITDLIEAIGPGSQTYDVGIRPGEKLHEEMISADDSYRTVRQADRYVVKPTVQEWWFTEPAGEPVPQGFSYRSDTNDQWLTPDDLRALIAAS